MSDPIPAEEKDTAEMMTAEVRVWKIRQSIASYQALLAALEANLLAAQKTLEELKKTIAQDTKKRRKK